MEILLDDLQEKLVHYSGDFNSLHGVRVGEAAHPGPAASRATRRKRQEVKGGGDLISIIQPLLTKIVKELLEELFRNFAGSGTLESILSALQQPSEKQRLHPQPESILRKDKGNSKGKGTNSSRRVTFAPDIPDVKSKGKGKRQPSPRREPPVSELSDSKGNGKVWVASGSKSLAANLM